MQDLPHHTQHYIAKYIPSPLAASIASMIKFPPEKKAETYDDLVCTEADQKNIFEIITTMADNGKLSLLMKKNHLQSLGAQINHVHPLKFLSTIVTNPRLRECLHYIFGDYFKRNGFMDGIGPSLSREAEKGKLDLYITDFANEVGVPKENLNESFKNQDWEGLVRVFLES